MRIFNGFEDLKAAVGTEVGVSDWIEITQDRINSFAEATCDEQWIHVDQERAKAEIPGGKTIAHGLLSLEPDADVHPLGDGPEGVEEHPELRRRPHPLSLTGAGRFKTARPRQHCAKPRTCRPNGLRVHYRVVDRDRGRPAPGLRRRGDRRCTIAETASRRINR